MAWGPEGHAMIADIAQAHLDPAAAAQVRKLLALEGDTHLDQVSSWADAIRRDQPQTGPWHYVDIPLADRHYHAARDCKDSDCVVARIPYFAHILADRSASPARRLEALKWVVHLVGDIHQPLHAEDDHDKGGNDVKLDYFGRHTNLHRMWDSAVIEHALHVHVNRDYTFDHQVMRDRARKLDADITPAERLKWAPQSRDLHKDAVRWADGSHALARGVAYADLPPASKRTHGWSKRYQAEAWPVIKQRLQKAGVRLAAVLNQTLG
nr:S1/P1 nuclease [Oleiagrimonas sp. C23AA]